NIIVGNRFALSIQIILPMDQKCSEWHQICLIKAGKAYNKKYDPAMFVALLHMVYLVCMDIYKSKTCFIFSFFCFKIYISGFINSIIVTRRRCFVVCFIDLRLIPRRIVHIDNLNRCRFLMDDRAGSLQIIIISYIQILFKGHASLTVFYSVV